MLRAAPPSTAELELLDGSRALVRIVVNPRARRISLRIDSSKREAIAVAPSARQVKRALAFATERVGWIADQLARLPQSKPFSPGATIPLQGEPHRLEWAGARGLPRLEPAKEGAPARLVIPALDEAALAGRARRFLASLAKRRLAERVAVHAATLGASYSRLTVKDTKSRWGSCTAGGALAFSWRVILAPPAVLDYLAAHEVAHLIEMNHSPRFWALVRQCQPDYAKHRTWLRRFGAHLHAYGAE